MATKGNNGGRLSRKRYERELEVLQRELILLQEHVKREGLRMAVVFEGRDAAGKGGIIKAITERTNPRVVHVVALAKPSDHERTQWYFQRYVAQLPAAGEIVLFDRSWYNRAGVERVMGFCSDAELREFERSVPEFERMLIDSGIVLVKYWLSISDETQEQRFRQRIENPLKRWKLSPIDIEALSRSQEYARAKDEMFAYSDTDESPWWVVPADDKRRARLNCIAHLLTLVDFDHTQPPPVKLPPRTPPADIGHERPPLDRQRFVPQLH